MYLSGRSQSNRVTITGWLRKSNFNFVTRAQLLFKQLACLFGRRSSQLLAASFERKRLTRVPKNGVSRSKRLLKPQPKPHQHRGLELRTSLTKAGMVRNVERYSPTHLTSSIQRLLDAPRVERTSPKSLHLKNNFLVFSPPMATRTQIEK